MSILLRLKNWRSPRLPDQGKAGQGLHKDQVGPPAAVIIRPGTADDADLNRGTQDAVQQIGQLPVQVNGEDPLPGAQVEPGRLLVAAD